MSSKIQYYPNHRQMLLSILKVFYDPIHLCLMNVLMHHTLLTDKQIAEKMNMDVPSIRSSLNKLLCDKLVQHKMKVQTEQEKTIKYDYYYINMKLALNSFMYRLYNTRKKLEEEKERSFCAGRYQCIAETCGELYDDSDIISIHDLYTGLTICRMCNGVVEPIEDTQKRKEAREEVGRFNDKIYNPFLQLYNKVKEDILEQEMIQPDFDEINNPSANCNARSSGDASKFNAEIVFNNDTNWSADSANNKLASKENPSWIYSEAVGASTNSAGSNLDSDLSSNANSENNITQMMAPGRIPGALTHITELDPEKEIMELLMSTEYVIENNLAHHLQQFTASSNQKSHSDFQKINWPANWNFDYISKNPKNAQLLRLLYDISHDTSPYALNQSFASNTFKSIPATTINVNLSSTSNHNNNHPNNHVNNNRNHHSNHHTHQHHQHHQIRHTAGLNNSNSFKAYDKSSSNNNNNNNSNGSNYQKNNSYVSHVF